jgi:phospho-N-acetylmuramoyl-pentapeptide-transferase
MGGLLIIPSIVLPTLLWADIANPFIWIVCLSTLAFGAIGFMDDYLKIRKRHNKGLSPRSKFILQISVSLLLGVVLLIFADLNLYTTKVSVPFFKLFRPDLGPLYVLFALVVLVGASNAVNLTDGLDGLAIGSVLIASGTSRSDLRRRPCEDRRLPGHPLRQGLRRLTVFTAAMVGASLGFLWFNCHPAEIFMGDVGSMASGGPPGRSRSCRAGDPAGPRRPAVRARALSVILQVGSFKLWKQRIFRMAPLHHHFELSGWNETKVVIRFWIVALIFSLMSLATLKLR